MADTRPHLGTGESLSADLIAQRGFISARRGYDVKEVKDFLGRVAAEVRDLRQRVEAADAARREAEERARHPRLDEETLMGAVGEETAAILRTARTAAAEIRTKAEEQATAMLREAQAQAEALRAEAEAVVNRQRAESEQAAEGLRAAAAGDAERIRGSARQEAETLRQQADQERRLTVEAAQGIREKILGDLARRRRVATVQIEQLRAGRERLLDAYMVVRRTLEEVTDELQRADAEARAAAETAGQKAAANAEAEEAAQAAGDGAPAAEPMTVSMPVIDVSGGQGAPSPATTATGGAAQDGSAEDGPADGGDAPPAPGRAPRPAAVPSGRRGGEDPVTAPTEVIRSGPREPAQPGGTKARGGGAQGRGPDMTATDAVTKSPAPREPEGPEGSPAKGAIEHGSPSADGGDHDAGAVGESVRILRGGAVTASPPAGRSRPRRSGPKTGRASSAQPKAPPPPETVSPEEEEEEEGDSDVGGIFARIRADRGGQPDPEGPAVEKQAAEKQAAEKPGAKAGETPAPADPTATAAGETADADSDERHLQRRDEAVADIEVSLARRLKRVLQDEQNQLLDRLRNAKGVPKAGRILRPLAEQRAQLMAAGRPLLERSVQSGVAFGLVMVGSKPGSGPDPAPVDDLAEEMGDLIARPLHRRLEQAFTDAGDDDSLLGEALGAAYREWKSQRIDQLARDAVAGAFSRGAFEAVPDGTALRWLVDDDDGPCPDCDDNALAGSLLKGEMFPTGQAYPPAHAGCRCLLVAGADGD